MGVYKSRKNNYYLRMFLGGGSCNLVRYSNTYVKGYNGLKIEVGYNKLYVKPCKSINFSTSNPKFRLIKGSKLIWTLWIPMLANVLSLFKSLMLSEKRFFRKNIFDRYKQIYKQVSQSLKVRFYKTNLGSKYWRHSSSSCLSLESLVRSCHRF